ncbi:MAG: hypothetical protein LBB45_06235 [Methanobrevibacter sp.]|jgi:hypothetical protein|nr:hypothetical protein [Candidatus Methanovirga basalitermitum]
MINLYISILEENQNELIEIVNCIINFNSNIGIERGFLFKIIGNQYVASFINELTSKNRVDRRIEDKPCLLGDVLFDIYESRGIKYVDKKFIVHRKEFNVVNDYFNLYFLIARLSLHDEENNLLEEFEEKIKDEKSNFHEFNFYFSNRELGLFERIDTEKMKELSELKNLLKANDFYFEDYYDYNKFAHIFKRKLESIAFKEQEKLIKKQKKIMNKLANSNLADIFYSFVAIEKYRRKRNISKKENEYINRFLSEEQYSINRFNREFGQNSFQKTVNFVMDEGMANPSEEEFDNVMNRLIEYYEEKDFTNKSIESLEKYLKNNGILENEHLKNRLNIDENIISVVDDFDLFNSFNSLNIYPILEYLKKEEDSELNNVLKKIHDDLKDILGNSYLLYVISFFHDLTLELELLQNYYIDLLDNGIIDQFYHDEWQNDEVDDLDEEKLEDVGLKSMEDEFIVSTIDFLREWNSYYKLFRTNIFQKKNNLKFIALLILSMDNDKLGKLNNIILNLKILVKYIYNEIDEIINILDDLKFLNDHLENLKGNEMRKQYDTIRKFINKWKRNVYSFKRTCKTYLLID